MKRAHAFRQPPVSYDYNPLIETLARCREEVVRLKCECGDRTPLCHQAEAVTLEIEALAKLLPADAADKAIPKTMLHSTHRR